MQSLFTALVLTASAASASAVDARPAWVEMDPAGGSVVRALVNADACPVLRVDGSDRPMRERAAPARLPVRTNNAGTTQPAAFAARVCEARLARGVRQAVLGDQALPLPRRQIDRIVLIGDTGCRLKDADKAWQGCNDPAKWPFARIAGHAAALHPDLVLHLGDYLYRENPCPTGQTDCAGTAFGYGEAGWRADFLDPATPLLHAAPWAMVRGNHEECARAGQGWWRLLDPHDAAPGQDCVDPANDDLGNRGAPYAIDLGGGARLIIADLVALANPREHDPAWTAATRADLEAINVLAAGAQTSFVASHYPFNAVSWPKAKHGAKADTVKIGTPPLKAFAPLALPGVRATFAGHVHEFQFARFSDRPDQVIAGFSGTLEDPAPAPHDLAAIAGKAGTGPITALTTIADTFGFALIERKADSWRLTAYALDGRILARRKL